MGTFFAPGGFFLLGFSIEGSYDHAKHGFHFTPDILMHYAISALSFVVGVLILWIAYPEIVTTNSPVIILLRWFLIGWSVLSMIIAAVEIVIVVRDQITHLGKEHKSVVNG